MQRQELTLAGDYTKLQNSATKGKRQKHPHHFSSLHS